MAVWKSRRRDIGKNSVGEWRQRESVEGSMGGSDMAWGGGEACARVGEWLLAAGPLAEGAELLSYRQSGAG